ncbi:hypothetical protein [Kribbella sp. VKM Ac-2566]|uniref:hypothetical protein n=1 Tax=Kribbella sp. VKM Ac-2566 TaxID=2512218 RepID=UPI001063A932|nr:hypothetical protein [Kribbella sp. VKM Ac-2566]TDX08664.1 hypothetical protein EV647_0002 [Kribbella sp. VKM Ac-2566]
MTTTAVEAHPTSISELFALSAETARALAGAEQSAWNGHIIESSSAMLGLAHWDGTLYLDRESIVDPLRHLYEHAGATRPTPTLIAYRESLATLLHEHAHFLGPTDATQEAAREAFTKLGSRQLEEGVTEAWAQDHLDDFIHRLGIDKVAPGIDSVRSNGYYAAFVPAVRELTTELDTRNGFPAGETLSLLNRQTAAGQFPLLVDAVYNSTRLPDLEPPSADTRSRLESILRSGLAHLETYELSPPDLATTNSLATANQVLSHLDHETHTAEATYTFNQPDPCVLPPPTRRIPSPHESALSGVTPPSPARPSSPLSSTSHPASRTHPHPTHTRRSPQSAQSLERHG